MVPIAGRFEAASMSFLDLIGIFTTSITTTAHTATNKPASNAIRAVFGMLGEVLSAYVASLIVIEA